MASTLQDEAMHRVRVGADGRMLLPAQLRHQPEQLLAATTLGSGLAVMPTETLEDLERSISAFDLDPVALSYACMVQIDARGRFRVPRVLRRAALGWDGESRADQQYFAHFEGRALLVYVDDTARRAASATWRRLLVTEVR